MLRDGEGSIRSHMLDGVILFSLYRGGVCTVEGFLLAYFVTSGYKYLVLVVGRIRFGTSSSLPGLFGSGTVVLGFFPS